LPWITAVADGALGARVQATVSLVPDLPPEVGAPLAAAGYLECWATPIVVNNRVTGALAAASRATTLPGTTMRQRLRRARDVSELAFIRRDYEDQLRHAAMHDRLTNIPNRARSFDALEHGVGQRGGPLTGVLYLDLDGFKPLNDTYGHAFGDDVLVEVANRINGALRPHDLAARLGGDEFAVLLEGLTDHEEADAIAERLCAVVAAPMDIAGVRASVGVSIGAAIGPTEGDRATLLNAADQAMYEAKRAGKGAVRTVHL
jgi:diguanylate cyclase (GGDEF)-like protein